MRSLKKESVFKCKSTGVSPDSIFLFSKILSRLEDKANNLGRLSLKEAHRALSLALPFNSTEADQLLQELEKCGLIRIEGKSIFVDKVRFFG